MTQKTIPYKIFVLCAAYEMQGFDTIKNYELYTGIGDTVDEAFLSVVNKFLHSYLKDEQKTVFNKLLSNPGFVTEYRVVRQIYEN
jgi:hypothetical protein